MRTLAALSIFLVVAGCGTETASRSPGSELPPDPYGDPPGFTGDPFAGYGPVTSIALPAGDVEAAVPVTGSWSVQVAACGSMEAALSLKDRVSTLTDEPVFIDEIGSYWKVRVGAFPDAGSSASLRNLLRSSGYPDAWSVERTTTP